MPREADLATSKEGASIRVGSTGKVGDLMSRELDNHTKDSTKAKASSLTKAKASSLASIDERKLQSSPVSVPCSGMAMINRKMQRSKTMPVKEKSKEKSRAVNPGKSSQVPILHSNDIVPERSTSMTDKSKKKGQNCKFVQVVDITCGSNPMRSRLRKLGFSKLSESFA